MILNKVVYTSIILQIEDLSQNIISSEQQGFSFEVFNNTRFSGEPIYKGHIDQIRFTNGGDTPLAPGLPVVDYSARFTAQFTSPIDGEIEFSLSALTYSSWGKITTLYLDEKKNY